MKRQKQLHLDVQLDNFVTLDNFISCPSTNLVLKAVNHFISNKPALKTLYLWGKSGVGKNYLIHAVNKKCLDKDLSTAFLSFSTNSFKDPALLDGLEELDVIFFDAFGKFPWRKEWEIALFNLINSCLTKGTRIFFSSNQVVKNLDTKLGDLRSRLLAVPAFELPEVSEEEKILALEESAQRKGLIFEDRVLTYILNHTSRSLSDLLKLMTELDSFSLERKRKISIPLVKDLLASKANN